MLGLNGSGKSTLLKIMAGEDPNFDGEAMPMPNLKVGFLPQEPELDPAKTVREEVEAGLGDVMQAKTKLEEIYTAYAEPDADFDALATEQAKYEAVIATAGADTGHQLEIAADALRLPDWDAPIEHLSGGEKRRVALCRLLLSRPDMLLLDEPTNHLDAESVEWLEQFLLRFPGKVHLSEGRLGGLMEMRAFGKQDSRAGGEDMMVLGTHLFDLMRMLAGDPLWCAARVLWQGRDITPSNARLVKDNVGPVAGDQVFAHFAFSGGVNGTFTSDGTSLRSYVT